MKKFIFLNDFLFSVAFIGFNTRFTHKNSCSLFGSKSPVYAVKI